MIWDRTNRPLWLRCTVGVLVAIIAAGIRLHFLGILESRVTFVTFFPAVAIAALYGGLGPGLLATVVSAALVDYFLMAPVGSFAIANIVDTISLVVFLASGTLISYLAELHNRAQARAHKAEEQSRLAAERKQAEATLQRQAELLHLSFDAIIVWRLGGAIETWNKGAEELYRYSQEEAVGQVTHDLLKTIHPEPWHQIEARLRELKFWEGELKHRTREGQEVIVSARLQLVHGADGVERVLEANRDITERKRAEDVTQRLQEVIKQERDTLSALVSSMPDEVWFADSQKKFTLANPPALREFALGSDSDIDIERFAASLEVFRPDGSPRPVEEAPALRSLRGDVVKNLEEIVRIPANGELRHRQVNSSPVRDADGNIIGSVSVVRDITEHKRAEETLRESEEQFRRAYEFSRAILDTADALILVLDKQGCIVQFNAACERLTGWKTEEVIGQCSWELLLPEEQHAGALEQIQELTSGEYPSRHENDWILRDGSRRWIAWTNSVLLGADGEIEYILGTGIDITERKQAEARLTADLAALTRMHALSSRLLETGGIQSLLQEIMDSAVLIVGAKMGTLQLLEHDSLRIVAAHGHQQPFLDFFASAESQASVCGEATKRGERVVVSDVEMSSLFMETPSLAILREAGVRAVQSTPMMSRTGKLLGILTTQWGVPYVPDEHDLWRIDLLARQAADLIEHSWAERELFETNQRLKALMDALPVGVSFSDDLTCRSITGNPAVLAQFEVGQEDNLSASAPDPTAPGRQIQFFKNRRKISDKELPLQRAVTERRVIPPMELEVLLPSGRRWFAQASGAPLFDMEGKIFGGVAVTIDITEHKQAEAALRQSEERFRSIAENQSEGLMIFDPQGNLIYQNPASLRIHGYADQEDGSVAFEKLPVIWQGWADQGQSLPFDQWPISRVMRGELIQNQVLHARRQDTGLEFDASYNGCPIYDGADNMVLGFITIREITEQRKAEEALRKSHDELELRVQERTAELVRSNQALQEFASIASHDLQEPLRKVQSFGNMLRQKSQAVLGEAENDYLNRMLDATRRMQVLLKSLLEYSRVTSQQEPFQEVDLCDIVRDVLSDLEVRIRNSGGEVKVGKLPAVAADSAQMRQLFQNLISNALKFHKEGEKPVVTVNCTVKDGACEIVVEDNGIGFDQEFADKIFAPFQRLHGRNSQYEGTGMGLAICKKIVERHGWNITAKSITGEGSTFIITFPGKSG